MDDLRKVRLFFSNHFFSQMVQQENISLNESIMSEDNEASNNDRELIAEFLELTKEVQRMLNEMESNNKEMH